MIDFKQLIGGEWVGAANGGTWDLVNPATEEVIETLPFGDAADLVAAVEAAHGAFREWSHLTAYQRSKVLLKAADIILENIDEFARITTEESGKPFAQSKGEWLGAPNQLRWAAGEAERLYGRWIPSRMPGRRIDVIYQPIGVIGVITAWNFPVYNQMRAISSALAVGNTVVSRPSEYTPRSAMLIGWALTEAGAPAGVINIVNGEPESMGQVMLEDKRVGKIQFTGSTRVGRLLMDGASKTITRLSLELGGNAPVLVFPDAGDIAEVARKAMATKVRNNGQVCISPQRFYVHESVVGEFTDVAVSTAKEQVLGNGLDPDTTVGPLINARQRERVERIVSESVSGGATLLVGGTTPERPGYFYEPTVVTDVSPDLPIHNEEIFGPVMPVIPFDDVDAAIARANDTDYGLAAYVYTRDMATAFKVSEELEFGMISINDWLPSTPEAPFGGFKQSGLGRESGTEGILEYVEPKTRYFGNLG
ncbi:MAG: NAD-dependent succinate-semialdehyde dehydrogenase [Acidimicrobiales bacterium]|jgi:acyl-CoA reductase-like NAD-dependent aldehyde dehydrogenase|nr:NAD-dependent succinate-semialdehyde dehydrogenase [Acidimicrobiales bacterium]HLV91413.1 NAD-dependent succinate-semialdehyde dehydrogenase [Acidimicrobiia bacterium]